MPGSDPETNGDLSADIRQLENALARCASQVKMIKHCQDENDAQTRHDAPRDKRTYFREINYIAAAFQYQKKNYKSA